MPDPHRLLVVADHFAGGLGIAAQAHAAWFAAHGWDVVLAAPDASAPPSARAVALPVPASATDLRAMRAAARDLRRLVRRERPDVLHAHGTRSQLVCLLAGRRPWVTMHGSGGRVTGQHPVGSAARAASRRLAARLAIRAYSASPVGGGWTTLLHASPRLAELPLSSLPESADEAPAFLWVGRMDSPKRPEVFVEACARAARGRRLNGVLIGSGPRLEQVRALAERIGAPVEVLGDQDDVGGFLDRARAVFLFSDFEGVPFAVQEAMWAGRPVVLSPLPSLRWFAGDTALYADDVEAAVRAMDALADLTTARRLGAAAAARVRALVTEDAPYPALLADYRSRLESTER